MIILHMGFPKTGTTTLQRMFEANNDSLVASGVCYPLIDSDFKQRYLKVFDHKRLHLEADSQANLKNSMRKMSERIERSGCSTTILSCEELNSPATAMHDRNNLRKLRAVLSEIDPDIRLVAYVRNPADFYLSMAQEFLKRRGRFLEPEGFSPNFASKIRVFEEVFEVTASVRELSRPKLVENDILRDFLSVCGLEHVDTSSWKKINANESLSPEVMFLLDVVRRTGQGADKPVKYNPKQQERLWRKLRDASRKVDTSAKPCLFEKVRDSVLFGSETDAIELNKRYGIEFEEGKAVAENSVELPKELLSEVERIVPVDRRVALAIWAQFTYAFFGAD
ncbi:sulfotransferase domain-containing protein [Shimia thalassica]|uniref:sulfotransferase domain-containing protein n=1 Tax=Shimia thalassica TaxID=1715693 RepID=UPI0026E3C5C6|nr:sulfotransferase domain-containing protein [Shimia thalassica]MDO6481143.1 sulfotransferase domain-containing protein [Shimia thalassica]